MTPLLESDTHSPIESAPPLDPGRAQALAQSLRIAPARGFVIVVLTYRGLSDTLECLASLRANGVPLHSILVVDNGSPPEEAAAIAARHLGLAVLRLTTNVGYCGGNNAGYALAEAAGATYALILNNDTTVEPGFLETLARFTDEHPEAVLLTPKITWYHSPDTTWFAGGSYSPWRGYPTVRGRRRRDDGRFDAVRRMTFATGCALAIRLDRLGRTYPFIPELFGYAEDVELSLHVLRNGGAVVYMPYAVVRHKEGLGFQKAGGQPFRTYLSVRNLLFVARAYLRWYHWITAFPGFTAGYVGRFAAIFVLRRDSRSLGALLRGFVTGLCAPLPGMLRDVAARAAPRLD
jgi:GT2 family glycosyltransferase